MNFIIFSASPLNYVIFIFVPLAPNPGDAIVFICVRGALLRHCEVFDNVLNNLHRRCVFRLLLLLFR